MSTSYAERPMRAVHTPDDAGGVREHLDRQRGLMASLLIARDAVIGSARGVATRAADLADRWGLSWALLAARRALGWVVAAASAGARVLRVPGLRPALVWAAFTAVGQSALGRGAGLVGRAMGTASGLGLRAITGTLRLFGNRGHRAAAWVEAKASQAKTLVSSRLNMTRAFAGELLTPSGLVVQGVTGWAKLKALTAVLSRALPGRWSLLGRLVAGIVTLPRWARREATRMIGQLWAQQAAAVAAEDPQDNPTPTAPVVAIKPATDAGPDADAVANIEPARAVGQDLHPSLSRYPAKRTTSTRKRR